MKTTHQLAASIGAVLALGISMLPGTAHAAGRTFHDARGDVTGVMRESVDTIRVKNKPKTLVIAVTSRVLNSAGAMNHQIYAWRTIHLDTNARRPGPEWGLESGYESELEMQPVRAWKRRPVAKWKTNAGSAVAPGRCALTVTSQYDDIAAGRWRTTITIRKKKGCFTAGAVRVRASVVSSTGESGAETTDTVPNGPRTFGKLVRVGHSRTMTDRRDKVTWWNDIRSVGVVTSRTRLAVSVNHRAKTSTGTQMNIFLDTNGDGVPEWVVWVADAGGGHSLNRTNGWTWTESSATGCAFTDNLKGIGSTKTSISLPIACIGKPSSVRLAVNLAEFPDGAHAPLDWLGRPRHWTARVALP